MNKITVSKVLLSTLIPSVAISSSLFIVSCGSKLSISTKNVQINTGTGEGSFTISLPEQPLHNEATVTIHNKTKDENKVIQLLGPNDSPYYDGKTSVVYTVANRELTVYTSFAQYQGESASSSFDLNIQYTSMGKIKKNNWIRGVELSVDYKQNPSETLHILSLNDFHGAGAGYGDEYFNTVSSKNPGAIRIANAMAPILEDPENPGSVFLTCGDNTSGECFSTSVHAESTFNVLRSMGARYSAIGNHAFEWGIEPLTEHSFDNWGRTDQTSGQYFVTSNIITDKSLEEGPWESDPNKEQFKIDFKKWYSVLAPWADPYKILNLDGHLVCLIGLTTQLTNTDGNRQVTKDLGFINYQASVQYANYLCHQELGDDWYNSIETFILLTHVESEGDPETHEPIEAGENDAVALAENCSLNKLGAVLSGHSHKLVCGKVKNTSGNDVWVGQAETAGRQFLDTKLEFNNQNKPGERLTNISMELHKVEFDNSSYSAAKQELKNIRNTTTSELVKNVIKEYDIQKDKVKNKLRSVIAHRNHGLAYPVSHHHPGHEYFCSDQVCDQLGAWISLGQMCGFSSAYNEDIRSGKVLYPSISLFTIDSANVELPEPTVRPANVTLKDMYSIQGYENPMHYGLLSVWQLGNIIDYLLSGAKKFNYSANNDYFSDDFIDKTSPHNLMYNAKANPGTPVKCCEEYAQDIPYKDKKVRCNYLCGPLQWYGFRFNVKALSKEDQEKYDRQFELEYEDAPDEVKNIYPVTKIPKLWIYDPYIGENFDTIYQPDKWISCKDWLIKYKDRNGLIPCVVNSFIYTGGNAQNTMFAKYFDYNGESAVSYSKLSREMLEEFCALTESEEWKDILHFDLSNDIVKQLISGYNPTF